MTPLSRWFRLYRALLRPLAVIKLVLGAGLVAGVHLAWQAFGPLYAWLGSRYIELRPMLRDDLGFPDVLPTLPSWPIWVLTILVLGVAIWSATGSWAMATFLSGPRPQGPRQPE